MAYIDTHEAIKALMKEGFEENQAEAITNVINKRDGTLAIRADLVELKGELRADIKDLKSEMIKWFVGTQFATLAIVIAIIVSLK